MDEAIAQALETDRLIDITTTGRKTGDARRIEIGFTRLDGRFYITGRPGRRSWYANLLAQPDFTFHLKQSAQADLGATAQAVRDPDERRRLFEHIVAGIDAQSDVEDWIANSPLVEVEFTEP